MPSRVTKFDKFSTESPQLNRRSPSGSLGSQDSIMSSDSVSESRSRFDKVKYAYCKKHWPSITYKIELFKNCYWCIWQKHNTHVRMNDRIFV